MSYIVSCNLSFDLPVNYQMKLSPSISDICQGNREAEIGQKLTILCRHPYYEGSGGNLINEINGCLNMSYSEELSFRWT